MKSTSLWMLALYGFVPFVTGSDSAQVVANGDHSGFISIDCGTRRDYMDEAIGILYQTDKGFIESGTNHELAQNINLYSYAPTVIRQLMTVRSFPEGERNCYTLKPKQDKQKFLMRAIFAYGNYDLKNQPPEFDLYLGVNFWTTVRISPNASYQIYPFEIIMEHDSTREKVQVCLVNKGQGTPFINTLELRPLNNSLYPVPLPLMDSYRIDLGSGLTQHTWTRYKDDVYDRLWFNVDYSNWHLLQTSAEVKAEDSIYELPSEVLRTASQPLNPSVLFTWNGSYDISAQYYLFLHFAEIEKLPHGHKRIISVTFDDENSFSQKLTLEYLKPVTLSSNKFTKGYINFTIKAATDSDASPILNAFELCKFLPQPNSPTAAQDAWLVLLIVGNNVVNAIMEIKHIYGVSKISWQGDPCVPSNFAWDGLNCSSGSNIRITSLNLSSSKLAGQITPSFASLEKLEFLDLSNNELTGPLPEFLATLSNLKFINVTGNNLTGSIPKALREKANLRLSTANNPDLCQANACKKPTKFVIPLIASLSALVIVIVLVSLVIWRFRKKRVLSVESRKIEGLKRKNQAFSYSEVIRITNNFETAIGEGRFGKVYLGTLKDGAQVAVKLLSLSSSQGYKEFESEAQLLTVTHHRNLVSLVGFCDSNNIKALIYEYMDLGDLGQLLSENNTNVLKWKERLQVAVDAAKGLEYLHNGCKTPIIHGNMKPSNILLNKSMVAKIADFGLSRAFANEKDSNILTQPVGTSTYVDPEFKKFGRLNKKSDVYSFGMILLQLITGHPPIRREPDNYSFDWVRSKIESGDVQGIVDPRLLKGEFHDTSTWKAVEVAMSCIFPESEERPEISSVLHKLSKCLDMLMDHANSSNDIPRNSINHSRATVSMTTLSAR